jgi:hypothetical protein
MLPPSSRLKAGIFSLEDGGSTFLKNVSKHLLEYMASYPRRQ